MGLLDSLINTSGKVLTLSENVRGIGENFGAARDAFSGRQVSNAPGIHICKV